MKIRRIVAVGLFAVGVFLFFGCNASAANVGDVANFNVDKNFDASGSTQLSATLVRVENNLYFYVDSKWLLWH